MDNYTTDGNGNWNKRTWSRQCPKDVFIYGRCQGVEGHKGVHWCYDLDGSLNYEDNEDDPTEEMVGCAGSIPPGHSTYVNPVDKQQDYFLNFFVDSVVDDPELIKKLEQDQLDGDYSITRPLKMEDFNKEDTE